MLSEDDLDIYENVEEKVQHLSSEIRSLRSQLSYSPAMRFGLLGAIAGNYVGGVPGLIGGLFVGAFLGSRIPDIEETDKEVLHNVLLQKEAELASLLKQHNISDKEITGIMSSDDLTQYQYPTYPFDGKWGELLGHPAKGFHMMVYGLPKQGKSIFCVKLSNYITKFGKVLYVAAEEGFSKTLQNKIKDFAMKSPNLDFSNVRTYNEIKSILDISAYQFVVLDSVNRMKITPEEMEQLKKDNKFTAFITIQQATKDGKFRGSQEYAHNCDIIVQVHAGQAYQEGRYKEPGTADIFGENALDAVEGTEKQIPEGAELKHQLGDPDPYVMPESEDSNKAEAKRGRGRPRKDSNYIPELQTEEQDY